MLMLRGDARYADLIEHTLYNAVLPGVSLDGDRYFYENPLEDHGTHHRQPWFGCACCPPNVARLLASLPGYFYSASGDAVWVHLYAGGSAEAHLEENRTVRLGQRTNYPWDGDVEIRVDGRGEFALMLRIPSWCEAGASIEVNGEAFTGPASPGSYAEVRRLWQPGDAVRLHLPMPVRRVEAHPYVIENVGRIALTRGPILYCVEGADNPGVDPRDLVLPARTPLSEELWPGLLGGVVVLTGEAEVSSPNRGWNGRLYRTVSPGSDEKPTNTTKLTAVPYHAWANREAGPMRAWIGSS